MVGFGGQDVPDEVCIAAYREGWSKKAANTPHNNKYFGVYVATAFCAPTLGEAAAVADEQSIAYFAEALRVMNLLADKPGYEYMGQLAQFKGIRDTPEWLRVNTPSVMIGTPDDFIRRLRLLEEKGVDEVLLRIDGFGHDKIMKSLELIGRKVIPAMS